MRVKRNRKKEIIYRSSDLGSIVENIVARQGFPLGCDISFQKNDRRIRSDKVILWASFGKLKDNLTVSNFLTKIDKRTKKIDFDTVHLMGPDGERIFGNTLLRTVREMEGIPTWEEVETAEIYEGARTDVKDKIDKGNDLDVVLDAYIDSLLERFSLDDIHEALERAMDRSYC